MKLFNEIQNIKYVKIRIAIAVIIPFIFLFMGAESETVRANNRKVLSIIGEYNHNSSMFGSGTDYLIIRTTKGKESVDKGYFYFYCDGVGDYWFDFESEYNGLWVLFVISSIISVLLILRLYWAYVYQKDFGFGYNYKTS